MHTTECKLFKEAVLLNTLIAHCYRLDLLNMSTKWFRSYYYHHIIVRWKGRVGLRRVVNVYGP